MSWAAIRVLAWIRYAEYVAAWAPISITERKHYRVIRRDDDWVAELAGAGR